MLGPRIPEIFFPELSRIIWRFSGLVCTARGQGLRPFGGVGLSAASSSRSFGFARRSVRPRRGGPSHSASPGIWAARVKNLRLEWEEGRCSGYLLGSR